MNSSATVLDWLNSSTKRLEQAGIGSARLDSLIMLEDCLKVDRSKLMAYPEMKLSSIDQSKLEQIIKKRIQRIPLAYIRNTIEFYGRDFYINNSVLIPRPETENIITELKKLNLPRKTIIADIGTGSGVLGITASLEIADSRVDLYDISQKALDIATINAKKYLLNLKITKSNLLNALTRTPHVIIVNLPYVPTDFPVSPELSFEPKLALFSEQNGMIEYESFWRQIKDKSGIDYIISESMLQQHAKMTHLAKNAHYKLSHTSNLTQVFLKN